MVKSAISDCPSVGKGVKSAISDCPSMACVLLNLKGDDPEAEKSKSDLPKVNGIKGGESPLHELSPRGKDQPNGQGYPGNPEDTPLETGPRRGAEEKEEKKGGWGQRGSIEKQSSTGSKFPPKKPATPTKQVDINVYHRASGVR
ncbi:Hypp5435 [Branchiostoma lanceolatum]|uniref:Hypp5435 protein n=1 Tax=Branchiostoma lanceolatum TaxID=7740 RepID=A0A8J9VPL0_BRALA|nr:Hypp5435 [Branchiostoma lanceolatum]